MIRRPQSTLSNAFRLGRPPMSLSPITFNSLGTWGRWVLRSPLSTQRIHSAVFPDPPSSPTPVSPLFDFETNLCLPLVPLLAPRYPIDGLRSFALQHRLRERGAFLEQRLPLHSWRRLSISAPFSKQFVTLSFVVRFFTTLAKNVLFSGGR